MATEVYKTNNILVIDNGTKKKYFNACWCTIDFTDNAVIITDEGRTNSGISQSINFSNFQDDSQTPYATEDAIFTYLSDKIG